MDLRNDRRTVACSLACMDSRTESNMDHNDYLPTRNGRCPRGYSRLQINILSVLKATAGTIAFWQIAESINANFGLNVSEGAVRGALERLSRYPFLIRNRSSIGRLKGNTYSFASEPCVNIQVRHRCAYPRTDYSEQPGQNLQQSKSREIDRRSPSILRDSTSLLLTLSDKDISFHWPRLAQAGFGTHQIERIIEELGKIGRSTERVLESLAFAEWEIEHGTMLDRLKNAVDDPASWVFSSLARNGSYRRPQGYVSPEEQATLDATEESNRRMAAIDAWFTCEFELWRNTLTSDEVEGVLPNPKPSEPTIRDSLLRTHFRKHAWPEILAAKSSGPPTPCGPKPHTGAGQGHCFTGAHRAEEKEQ